MAARKRLTRNETDALLKALLVLSRTVDHVLEDRPARSGREPLSSSKIQILRLLGQRGSHSSTRIASFLGVSKPAVSQIIDVMAAQGLVARKTSPHDRRGVELTLTLRGRACFRRLLNEQRHLIRNALRLRPGGRAEEWIRTLEIVAAALAGASRVFQAFCLQCGAHADGRCVLVGGGADCLFLRGSEQTKRQPRLPKGRTIKPRRP